MLPILSSELAIMTSYASYILMCSFDPGATAMFERISADSWQTLSYCCMPCVSVSTNLRLSLVLLLNQEGLSGEC